MDKSDLVAALSLIFLQFKRSIRRQATHSQDPILKRKHLSIQQTADLMEVSRKTAYNWIKDRKIEWFPTPGGRIRIFADSLGNFREDDEIFYR